MIRYVLILFFAVGVGVVVSMQLELSAARDQLATLSSQATALTLANENLAAELIEQKQQAKKAAAALVGRAKALAAINADLSQTLAQLNNVEQSPNEKAFLDLPLPTCLARLLNNKDSAAGVSGANCHAIDTHPANGPHVSR